MILYKYQDFVFKSFKMVWIIPRDTDDNMFKQLICLMTNMEANRHIFDNECKAIEEGDPRATKPFNVYDCNSITDEYKFVKGYVRCTGLVISNSLLEERMNSMNKLMPKDISLDLSYGYPTAHYTVARVQINKEYSRLVAYHQKIKGIKHKHHFIWINEPFGLNDFQELMINKSKTTLDTFELMRSLSTIIYDNAGIFASDNYGNTLTPGQPAYHINYPEIWQILGSDKIVNLPVIISEKFGIRPNITKKFEHLIPDTKKFSLNRNFHKDKIYYKDNGFEIVEEKPLNEVNLVEFDKKESIIKKLHSTTSTFNMSKLNITPANMNQLTLDIILKYLVCHVCCTPLYDKFYYIIGDCKQPASDLKVLDNPSPHIPICPMCLHSRNATQLENKTKLKVGISKSPFSASDVMGMIPKPYNVKYENYEKYKQLMSILLNSTIEVDKENPSHILYESPEAILVSELTNSAIAAGFNKPNACIFIVELSP